MGLKVDKWDLLTVWQFIILLIGAYFLYKRIVDGYLLVPRSRVRTPDDEVE